MSIPSRGTVFVIDDDRLTLSIVGEILRPAGFNVVTSDNAMCVPQISREKPDLILLDVNMPGLTGEIASRALLRNTGLIGHCLIVFHSNLPIGELRDKAREAGVAGFVQKANDPTAFIRDVESWVARARTGLNGSAAGIVRPPIPTSSAPPGAGRRVLIVDEDVSTFEVMRRLLEPQEVEIITSTSIMCAGLITSRKPDLVLMDVNFPGLDGDRAARALLSVPEILGHGLLVLFSRNSDEELAPRAQRVGAAGHLSKGTEPTVIVQKVLNWISVASSRRALRP